MIEICDYNIFISFLRNFRRPDKLRFLLGIFVKLSHKIDISSISMPNEYENEYAKFV